MYSISGISSLTLSEKISCIGTGNVAKGSTTAEYYAGTWIFRLTEDYQSACPIICQVRDPNNICCYIQEMDNCNHCLGPCTED